jgi:hypothetical protein
MHRLVTVSISLLGLSFRFPEGRGTRPTQRQLQITASMWVPFVSYPLHIKTFHLHPAFPRFTPYVSPKEKSDPGNFAVFLTENRKRKTESREQPFPSTPFSSVAHQNQRQE